MLTFYSEDTKKRRDRPEFDSGRLIEPSECPERIDIVIGRVREAGLEREVILHIWLPHRLSIDVIPKNIEGTVGHYALSAETSLSPGTFDAAQVSKDIALASTDDVIETGEPAFGLRRPPDNHAAFEQLIRRTC